MINQYNKPHNIDKLPKKLTGKEVLSKPEIRNRLKDLMKYVEEPFSSRGIKYQSNTMRFRKIPVNLKNYHASHCRHPEQTNRSIQLDPTYLGIPEGTNAYLNKNGTITVRQKNGTVAPGYCYNTAGKPNGAKNTGAMLRDLLIDLLMSASDTNPNGKALIENALLNVATTKPDKLLALASSLCPKENHNTNLEITTPAVITLDRSPVASDN